jgi:hypothetical protein
MDRDIPSISQHKYSLLSRSILSYEIKEEIFNI